MNTSTDIIKKYLPGLVINVEKANKCIQNKFINGSEEYDNLFCWINNFHLFNPIWTIMNPCIDKYVTYSGMVLEKISLKALSNKYKDYKEYTNILDKLIVEVDKEGWCVFVKNGHIISNFPGCDIIQKFLNNEGIIEKPKKL